MSGTFRDPIYTRKARLGCFGFLWLCFFVFLIAALATQYPWLAGGAAFIIVYSIWYRRDQRRKQAAVAASMLPPIVEDTSPPVP